jgi:hypothetical protein
VVIWSQNRRTTCKNDKNQRLKIFKKSTSHVTQNPSDKFPAMIPGIEEKKPHGERRLETKANRPPLRASQAETPVVRNFERFFGCTVDFLSETDRLVKNSIVQSQFILSCV